jgi:hypothetical protein
MKKNMNTIDRGLRILFATLILVLWLNKIITGGLAIALLIVAAVFVLTSVAGSCPIYSLLGKGTRADRK